MANETYRLRSWKFLRSLTVRLLLMPFLAVSIFGSVYLRTSPFAPEDAVRHLIAAGGCAAAAAVGAAPAREGSVGYHAKLDPGGTGLACADVSPPTQTQHQTQAEFRGGAKFVRP